MVKRLIYQVLIELKLIVRGVIGPGPEAEVAHLSPPGPVAVGDSLAQNTVGDGGNPENVPIGE